MRVLDTVVVTIEHRTVLIIFSHHCSNVTYSRERVVWVFYFWFSAIVKQPSLTLHIHFVLDRCIHCTSFISLHFIDLDLLHLSWPPRLLGMCGMDFSSSVRFWEKPRKPKFRVWPFGFSSVWVFKNRNEPKFGFCTSLTFTNRYVICSGRNIVWSSSSRRATTTRS